MTIQCVEMTIASSDIESNQVPHSRAVKPRAIIITLNAWAMYILFSERKYINNLEGSKQGSPWRYGTHVAIIFAGHDITKVAYSSRSNGL